MGEVAAVDMVGTPAVWAIWPAAVHGSASDVQIRKWTFCEIRSCATTALWAASLRLSCRVSRLPLAGDPTGGVDLLDRELHPLRCGHIRVGQPASLRRVVADRIRAVTPAVAASTSSHHQHRSCCHADCSSSDHASPPPVRVGGWTPSTLNAPDNVVAGSSSSSAPRRATSLETHPWATTASSTERRPRYASRTAALALTSAAVPSAIRCPSFSTVIRSATRMISRRSCSTTSSPSP